MAIIVELEQRVGQGGHLIRVDNNVATVGRGLDSTVILKDPHVDALHVILQMDEETKSLRCIDNGSKNGVWVQDEKGKKRAVVGGSPILSGQTLIVGKTRLKVYADNHVLSDTLQVSVWEDVVSLLGRWWVVGLLSIAVLLLVVLARYIVSPMDDKLGSYVLKAITPVLAAFVVGSVWAVIGKISRHETRFGAQSGLSLLALTLFFSYELVEPVLLFNLSLSSVAAVLNALLFACICFSAVYVASSLATHLGRRVKSAIAFVIPLGMLLSGLGAYLDSKDFYSGVKYDTTLVAPALQWRSPISQSEFMTQIARNYEEVGE